MLGAVSVATASMFAGSPAATVSTSTSGTVVLEHPSGLFETLVEGRFDGPQPIVERAGIVSTARKLMDGVVFPRSYD